MCRCIYKSSKKTGNTIQGDALEAVFARQLKNNPNIQRMRKKFGKDLEEIPDGDYVFLRRKSAKFKPIFCLFAYKAVDAICDGKPQKSGKQKVKLNFDQRLFEGFANESIKNVISDSHRFTLILLQPEAFVNKVKIAMLQNSLSYEMHAVDYKDYHKGEFFVEPTDKYPELFIKSKDYEYQHEARICLKEEKFSSIFDRYPLDVGKFNRSDYEIAHSAIYVEFIADFQKVVDTN